MELDQLRQLDVVERCPTMTEAARRLHLSQPALSRSMQRLEAEFRQPLFDREGRSVRLNDAGRVAVDWARQILRDERLMRDALDAVARRARTLRVGTVAPAPLWRLTSLMVERFPQETLTSESHTENDQVVRGVADGTFDLGIVTEPPDSALLSPCWIMDENLSVTLPPNHPLAARKSVTPADLDGETFLLAGDIGFWRRGVDATLPHATLIEQRDREVFAQLVHTTPYCAFVTDAPFLQGETTGRAVVPIDDASAHARFFLIVRKEAQGMPHDLFRWVQESSPAPGQSR